MIDGASAFVPPPRQRPASLPSLRAKGVDANSNAQAKKKRSAHQTPPMDLPTSQLASVFEICDLLQSPEFFKDLEDKPGWRPLLEMSRSSKITHDGVMHGKGLVATRDFCVGELVSIYPVHALGYIDGCSPKWEGCHRSTSSRGQIVGNCDLLYFEKESSWFGEGGTNNLSFSIDDPSKTYVFDVNPGRPCSSHFTAHFVNDAAFADFSVLDEQGCSDAIVPVLAEIAQTYNKASIQGANVAMASFGPAPLMAYITTKPVKSGEEFLATYGIGYWLGLCKVVDSDEEMDALGGAIAGFAGVQDELNKYGAELQEACERAADAAGSKYAEVTSLIESMFTSTSVRAK